MGKITLGGARKHQNIWIARSTAPGLSNGDYYVRPGIRVRIEKERAFM